ncbi:MAG TPA: Clp protease N-terminal domain-containing protein [Candidatus Nanoarchaeia archaeon]|nr:Clp protease N-terminal domain-containing protein [Candidatus Nanoarchaeia archaeon]
MGHCSNFAYFAGKAVEYARMRAEAAGQSELGTDHLFEGIMMAVQEAASRGHHTELRAIFGKLRADYLNAGITNHPPAGENRLAPSSKDALNLANQYAQSAETEVDLSHLVLGVLHAPGSNVPSVLENLGLSVEAIEHELYTQAGLIEERIEREPGLFKESFYDTAESCETKDLAKLLAMRSAQSGACRFSYAANLETSPHAIQTSDGKIRLISGNNK